MARKKKRLGARYDKSYETRDAGGANTSVMNWGAVEGETKFYKPKEGTNKIIIVPYIVQTENHPLVHSGDMKIGDMDYMMDLYIHRRIGPTEKDAICLKQNYGKACPICDAAKEFREKGEDESYQALKYSRRVYYNVLNARKIDNGLMIFGNVSHFLFEKELIEEARGGAEDGEIVDFAGLDEGSIIKFRGSPDSFKGQEFMKYKSFDFLEREEDLEQGIEEEAISFDKILIYRDAKELEKLLYDEEEEPDEEPEEEKEEKRTRKRKKSEEQDEEEEEEEKESKKKKGLDKKSSKKEKDTPCPHGYKFGKDCDTEDDCDDCEIWERCSEA